MNHSAEVRLNLIQGTLIFRVWKAGGGELMFYDPEPLVELGPATLVMSVDGKRSEMALIITRLREQFVDYEPIVKGALQKLTGNSSHQSSSAVRTTAKRRNTL